MYLLRTKPATLQLPMQPKKPVRIAIIGAGASGTLLTAQLCMLQAGVTTDIYLIDTPQNIGRGLAYSTQQPLHLLNVPAAKISALPGMPDHFVSWLARQKLPFAASDFVPRQLYGQYLADTLEKSLANKPASVSFTQVPALATAIEIRNNSKVVLLTDGTEIAADKVVLALGNFRPGNPAPCLTTLPPGMYAADPWAEEALDKVQANDPVLLIGSGLTMADVLMSLYARNHTGPVLAVSRHGTLPHIHMATAPYTNIAGEAAQITSVRDWFLFIRRHVQLAAEQGLCWRSVVDAFRPHAQSFWQKLPNHEKSAFLRHLQYIWTVSRHRMPPATAAIVNQLLESGQLKVLAGRIRDANVINGKAVVSISIRKGNTMVFKAARVINCTGPESDYRKADSRLVQDLLLKGFISPDPLFLGLAALPDGHLLSADQTPHDWLFSLGPPLKGVLWESTAIAEIADQAAKLAATLVRNR